jgi:hypothetical protein
MRTIPDDPRIDNYGQDSGYCGECGNHLDEGRCTCNRCDECDYNLDENNEEPMEITVPHLQTKLPVTLKVCGICFEKLESERASSKQETGKSL